MLRLLASGFWLLDVNGGEPNPSNLPVARSGRDWILAMLHQFRAFVD